MQLYINRDSEVDHTSDPQPMVVDGNECTNVHFGTNSNDPVSVCAKVLEELVQQHGLTVTVHDVPRDGNCMFNSFAYQLKSCTLFG